MLSPPLGNGFLILQYFPPGSEASFDAGGAVVLDSDLESFCLLLREEESRDLMEEIISNL